VLLCLAVELAKSATRDIPIVVMAGDPIATGLISNLSHPDSNVTGLSVTAAETAAKSLELIAEIKPGSHGVAFKRGARLLILGGTTLDGPRYIYWNFVSSSKELLEEAKQQWRRGEWGRVLFDLPPDDRAEFIPLPD
jgi:redox-sensitive bicupin YhaK (pirin superfamily)